jgi:hypothetical protein
MSSFDMPREADVSEVSASEQFEVIEGSLRFRVARVEQDRRVQVTLMFRLDAGLHSGGVRRHGFVVGEFDVTERFAPPAFLEPHPEAGGSFVTPVEPNSGGVGDPELACRLGATGPVEAGVGVSSPTLL